MISPGRHHARALLLQQHSRFREAITHWDLAMAEDPSDAHALCNRALCRCALNDYHGAQDDAEAGLALAPDQDYPHRVLAEVFCERGRLDDAATQAAAALAIAPDYAGNHCLVARVALDRRRWSEALAAADAGLVVQPDDIACLNLRAVALRQLGRVDEAAAAIEGALARAPSSAAVHANQGWNLLHAGDYRQAQHHFLEALRLESDLEWAREGLIASLKASSPVFRCVLAYQFWISRIRRTSGVAFMVGSYIAFRIVASSLEGTALFWPVVLILVGMFLLTWIADPLGELLLFLHPIGRHALSRDQRAGACTLGGLLLLLVALALPCAFLAYLDLKMAAIACVPAIMLGSTIFRPPSGTVRWIRSGFTIIALGIVATYLASLVALPDLPQPGQPTHIFHVLTHGQQLLLRFRNQVAEHGWMVDLVMIVGVQFLPALFRRR